MQKYLIIVLLLLSSVSITASTSWSGSFMPNEMMEMIEDQIIEDYSSSCSSPFKVFSLPPIIEINEIKTKRKLGTFLSIIPNYYEVSLKLFNTEIRAYEEQKFKIKMGFDFMTNEYDLIYTEDFDITCID